MHEAALHVIAKYHQEGEPFSLFLSSWSFDQVRKEALEIIDERIGDVQVRISLERQVRILLKHMHDLETVSVYREGDAARIAMPAEWPALTLQEKDWRVQIKQLVDVADMIVLFWGVTTPGLADEWEICSSGANPLKTVLVIPESPTNIWLYQIHRTFPRVVPLHEIPPMFALHSEFDPLIDRMKKIKSVATKTRSGLVDPNLRLRRFPMPPTLGRFDKELWVEA